MTFTHNPAGLIGLIRSYLKAIMKKTYQIAKNGESIKCLVCGLVSYNLHDVKNRYCAFCQEFHDDRAKNTIHSENKRL